MCFVLYVGADVSLPEIAFDKNHPGIHTERLSENEESVSSHFSTRHVIYLGSSQGCGCGFRHALLESDGVKWMPVLYEDEEDLTDDQVNMFGLYNYVKNLIEQCEKIELYGIWDGDFEEVPRSKEELLLDDLLDTDFYLKERGFYTIRE